MTEQLTEFSPEILSISELQQLAGQAAQNRQFICSNASSFGLDPDVISSQSQFLVGPFVSPAPIPTTFGGRVTNYEYALQAGLALTEGLNDQGYGAIQSMIVILQNTEVPRRGLAAMDAFVVPQNVQENKRIRIPNKSKVGTPYRDLLITKDTISSFKRQIPNQVNIFAKRRPDARRYKSTLAEMIAQDLSFALFMALGETSSGSYLDFASQLNTRITERFQQEQLPVIAVDQMYYDPFLRCGISDPKLFVERLVEVGFFDNTTRLLKTTDDDGKHEIWSVDNISDGSVYLTNKTDDCMPFETLCEDQALSLAPAKELAYFLTMSQMIPVIYGSENRGGYYAPYANAIEQVKRFGCTPVLYRTQPNIPEGYQAQNTLFDFYTDLLIP